MEPSDAAAIEQVLAGDQDSFRVLVERHSRNLFRLVYRMTGNEHDAEEVVQETFLRAYRKLGQFQARSNFSTWLHRVAVNCALDHLRLKDRRNKPLATVQPQEGDNQDQPDLVASVPSGDPTAERLVQCVELRERLDSALRELTHHERTAFVLRHFQGLSIQEIGRILGLRTSATKNTVFRAVKKLRQALEPFVGFSG
jgi:RNA polymerase sigma-70 factor (ECF subfamily)